MADSLVNSALGKLEGMAFDALKLQTETGKKVHGLKDDLAWLQLLLRDAEQRRRQEVDEYLELWLRQTREAAFDADDLLDEYFHEGRQLRCRGVLDLPSLLRWLYRSTAGLFVRHSICADVDGVKERLEQIKKKADDNSVKPQSLPTTDGDACVRRPKHYVSWSALSKCNLEDPENLVGIDKKMKQIKDWITSPDDTKIRTVVAIIGKSGAGKTTLASYVFESSEIRSTFQCAIWVHIPRKFRLVDVLQDMGRQTSVEDMVREQPEKKQVAMASGHEKMLHDLSCNLTGKKYLVVLDNVHNLEELQLFLSVLPEGEGNRGSAVVATMAVKSHHVYFQVGNSVLTRLHPCDHHVELKKLNKEDAREMFCRRVFGRPSFPKAFSNYATKRSREIEDLLDNSLPLTATLLAGILRTKNEEEWVDVINQLRQHRQRLEQQAEQQVNMDSKQQQGEEGQGVDQQPAKLHEAMKLRREQQGESESKMEKQQDQQGEMEKMKQQEQQGEVEVAQQHREETKQQEQPIYRQISLLDQILMLSFDDLPPHLKQCFLYFSAFKAEEHINAGKLIRLWVAEGLMRPTDGHTMEKNGHDYLKILISRCLINLVKMDYSNNITSVSVHERVLAFARSEARDINFLQVHHSTSDIPRSVIRRLAVQNAFDPYIKLTLAMPKLRTLLCECPEAPSADTDYWGISKAWQYIIGRVNCLSIYECKFLRVVDLQGMAHRSSLPHEIGWLIYLQYLGLAHTKLKKLPWTMKNLKNLQTLDITSTEINQVPNGFWKIAALRHVLAEKISNGPREKDALNNLQTLHGVCWKDSRLKNLINLQSLGLRRIKNCDGLVESLRSMECLTSLDLEAKDGCDLALHQLITMLALRNLQRLKLHGKVRKLPEAIEKQSSRPNHSYLLHNLTKFELHESKLEQAHINLIAMVPNLADLVLGEHSYSEEMMIIPTDGFPKLKRLQLHHLPNLKDWDVAENSGSAIKQLQETYILHCLQLTKIPIIEHLKHLDHLALLVFGNCPKISELPPSSDFRLKQKLLIVHEKKNHEQ